MASRSESKWLIYVVAAARLVPPLPRSAAPKRPMKA